jgi:hypothetical protein
MNEPEHPPSVAVALRDREIRSNDGDPCPIRFCTCSRVWSKLREKKKERRRWKSKVKSNNPLVNAQSLRLGVRFPPASPQQSKFTPPTTSRAAFYQQPPHHKTKRKCLPRRRSSAAQPRTSPLDLRSEKVCPIPQHRHPSEIDI